MYYSYQYDFCFLSAEFLGSAAPPIGPGLPVGRRGAAAAKTPKTQLNKTNNNNNNNSINNLEARHFIYGPWTFKNRIGFPTHFTDVGN